MSGSPTNRARGSPTSQVAHHLVTCPLVRGLTQSHQLSSEILTESTTRGSGIHEMSIHVEGMTAVSSAPTHLTPCTIPQQVGLMGVLLPRDELPRVGLKPCRGPSSADCGK
mmetsp:Transcript_15482/g.25789  ORF Transcript_15482/g.25789 Transcript_15482/m.25789 type:complete len:111 (+) Transcript_15482:123-455(+)